MVNKKRLINILIGLTISFFPLTAYSAPMIHFARFKDIESGGGNTANPNPRGNQGYYSRLLNQDRSFVEKYLAQNQLIIKHLTINNNLIFKGNKTDKISVNINQSKKQLKIPFKGFYIFDENQTVNGYLLCEPLTVLSDESFSDSPIRKMKLFSINQNYLTKISIPANISLNVYERIEGSFIERYIFLNGTSLEDSFAHVLLVDAYYPQDLEQRFTQEIYTYLEQYLLNLALLYS